MFTFMGIAFSEEFHAHARPFDIYACALAIALCLVPGVTVAYVRLAALFSMSSC